MSEFRADDGADLSFLHGGGEMGARMRATDWAATPLGPARSWPQSLKTAVRIMLTSRQAMFVWWGDQLINLYNDAYRSIVGGKHPGVLGQPAAIVWREIWDQVEPRAQTVLTGDAGTYDEALLLIMERHGYPEETYYTFSYSPIPNDGGGIGGIICANTDDTQRIIGQRQLGLLKDLASEMSDARTISEACRAAARALATAPRDLPFAALYLIDEERRAVTLAGAAGIAPGHAAAPETAALDDAAFWPFREAIAGGEPLVLDGLAARGADLPRGGWDRPPMRAVLLPIQPRGSKGQAALLVAGLNPYRQYDAAYQDFLGLVAGQIAAGIANAQAHQDERRRVEALAELDRAKTNFLSNASHEFRTPLTLMLAPLEGLLEGTPTAETVLADRQELALMHRNGLRLLKLVNTLLDFSRIEAGRVQAHYEPVDLALLTAELASVFRSAMERAGLRFVVECPPLPEPVHVDRDMWEKIVLNLLSNAFKYTFQGEVAVAVRVSEDGAFAELSVRDTGVGVPASELPRLFERFYRVEGQRGRTHEGTGIGLALVQELAKLHGGAVRAESEVNRGTTVTVSVRLGRDHLPAERVGAARSAASTQLHAEVFLEEMRHWSDGPSAAPALPADGHEPARREAAAPVEGGRPFVLLADDNADMRNYVGRLLGMRFDVQSVEDGEAAFEAALRRRPDLVLSDVMMPRLDGFGLLRKLRRHPQLGDVPVVLLSARAGEEARVEGLEAGADDYLAKPFNARELMARVTTNLEMARVRREAAEVLREEARRLETLNRTGAAVAAELDLERLVQTVTDAAVELTGAQFGAFFYNVVDEKNESYTLYTLSGAPREAFAKFPMPRNTAIFEPTFKGERVVRSDDILRDPRYGRNAPYHGMPAGHLPVRSYLAVPVIARSGKVLGGMFLGHPEPAVFSERAEMILRGIAAQASVAIDNAQLYQASRQAEETLRRVNEGLEQRIAAETRSRMEMEDALRQSQKMEAIGQLTGGVAHDFNNLLQVILGSLNALQRRAAKGGLPENDPALRRWIDAGIDGARRAATLTQRLLAFSRRQPLDPKPTDVNKLVTGMSDLLRRTLGETIVIESVLAGGLWRVAVDAVQLESALLNLAVNARDAMPGGGRLTIETANAHLDDAYAATHAEVTTGQYVMLAVSDTGSGMAKDVAARAFEPFFTTKEVGQGTGLGLSQVYGFIKQSGGHVKIYSEPGEGTTVRLYLPRLVGASAEVEATAESRLAPSGGRGETVLVVEDDPAVRIQTVEMLHELGYNVLEAPTGTAALRALESARDVVLLFTDVGLPGGLNGRQLADRAREKQPGLKVLFTTGYARNAIVHQGRLDPGVDLIPKPFSFAELAAKLRQVLDRPKRVEPR